VTYTLSLHDALPISSLRARFGRRSSSVYNPRAEELALRFPFEPPPAREFDAVGFGLNAVDHLVVVPRYPDFDTKTRLVAHERGAGGQTASTLAGLQRLGLRTAYAGRFGSDDAGRFGFESLRAEGVDTSRAEVVEGARNQIAFILIDARTGER